MEEEDVNLDVNYALLDYEDEHEGMEVGEGKVVCDGGDSKETVLGGRVDSRPSDSRAFNSDISFSELQGELNLLGKYNLCQDLAGAEWLTCPSISTFIIDKSFKYTKDSLKVFCAPQTEIFSTNLLRFKKYAFEGDFGSLPKFSHSPTEIPLWNINKTSFSNLVSLWEGSSQSFMKKLPEHCHTPVASLSFSGQSCKCSRGPIKAPHDFKNGSPVVVVVGDDYVPPTLGCMGTCPLIVRVPGGGDFECLKQIFADTFFPKKLGGTHLPANSIVYISLNSMLWTCPVQMYIVKLIEIINSLGDLLELSQNAKNIRFIPLVLPCPNTISGSKFHSRQTEFIEILKTVRAEVDGKHGMLLYTGFFWAVTTQTNFQLFEPDTGIFSYENTYIPPCKYLGIPNGLNVLGGSEIKLTKTAMPSPICSYSLNASTESCFWGKIGELLNISAPEINFPKQKDINASFIMGGRMLEDEDFFNKTLESPKFTPEGLIVIGHSLGKKLKAKLETEWGFSDSEIFSPLPKQLSVKSLTDIHNEIVLNSGFLGKKSTIIICCLGNSLLKPRNGFEKDFSVKFSEQKIEKGTNQKALHITGQVLSISDVEFHNLLLLVKEFAESLGGMVEKVILIPPIPRHFHRCCNDFTHFNSDFNAKDFVSDVRDWGLFMAQSKLFDRQGNCPIIVPALTSIFGAEITNSNLVCKDGVHLTEKNLELLTQAVVELVGDRSNSSSMLLENNIPTNVHISHWKSAFRKKFAPLTPIAIAPQVSYPVEYSKQETSSKKEPKISKGISKVKEKSKIKGRGNFSRNMSRGFMPTPFRNPSPRFGGQMYDPASHIFNQGYLHFGLRYPRFGNFGSRPF